MSQPNALPDTWVIEIFRRLGLLYGKEFLSRWDGMDLREVRADWCQQLAGVTSAGIAHALEALPVDRPPTVLQFKAACINRPVPAAPALHAPKADPARVAAAMAKLKRDQQASPKAWAHRLKEREESGEKLSSAQRAMWRAAIQATAAEEAE